MKFDESSFSSFGVTSSDDVERFQQENGLSLPKDYRTFLETYNGGVLKYVVCNVKEIEQEILVNFFLGLSQKEQTFDIETWQLMYRKEMPPGFVVIAIGATGMFILGTTGCDFGIYFWDDAHAFPGSSEEGGNTFKLSNTFTEFVDELRLLDDA